MSIEIIHNGITSPLKVGDTIGLFPVDGTSINWDATEEGAPSPTPTRSTHTSPPTPPETEASSPGLSALPPRIADTPSSTTSQTTSTTATNYSTARTSRKHTTRGKITVSI